MNDPSPIIAHNKENEKYSECRCRNGEEIHGDDIFSVVLQKCTPGLRWRLVITYHVLRDGGLADSNAEFEQLAVDPRRAPEGI